MALSLLAYHPAQFVLGRFLKLKTKPLMLCPGVQIIVTFQHFFKKIFFYKPVITVSVKVDNICKLAVESLLDRHSIMRTSLQGGQEIKDQNESWSNTYERGSVKCTRIKWALRKASVIPTHIIVTLIRYGHPNIEPNFFRTRFV